MTSKRTLKGSYKLCIASLFLIPTILSTCLFGQQIRIGQLNPVKKVQITINNCEFQLQKAETNKEKEQGLMFISKMDTRQGMIFIYDSPIKSAFWMLNTFIPLDIIFLDSNNKITAIHHNTKPLNSNILYKSTIESKFIIELNANMSEQCGINVQDIIDF
jgi:uncharacterized membrane protein (UPF0127 family)